MTWRKAMDAAGRSYLQQLGENCGWNICEMAQRADYARGSFYKLLERHGVAVPTAGPRTHGGAVATKLASANWRPPGAVS